MKFFGPMKESDPRYTETLTQVALLVAKKEWKNAFDLHETVFNKGKATDWYTRGNILGNLNRLDEAERCYAEAVKRDPVYIKAWYRKGWIHFGKRQWKAAYACFTRSAESEDRLTSYGKSPVERPWRPAAILMATVTLIAERDTNTAADLVRNLSYCYRLLLANKIISPETLPAESVRNGKFSDFLFENYSTLLDRIEPKVLAEIRGADPSTSNAAIREST